ncbi:MAG: DUF4251 domain-containing protein [Bacteroidales bacterium]
MKFFIIKNTLSLIFIVAVLLFTAREGRTQSSQQGSEAFTEMKELLSSGEYMFEADRMLPQSGASKMLTTTYTLKVTDTTAKAHLPYYGVAYSNVRYGGNGGISFDGRMLEYSREVKEDKERILVKFRIHGDNILYICSLSVSKSGSATLHIIPDNRQSISYWGDIKKID